MANKYCNLVGTNKIKDEYPKITEGFDKVQQDVDTIDSRVDTIITTPIDGEAAAQELVDARGGETTLGDRLDLYDAHMAENASKHIKESGSNSNGSYIKFDDGTLFCWNRIPFESGTPTAGGQSEVDWTFPSAFVNSDVSITRSPEVSTSAIDLASNYNLVGRGGNNLVARVILVHLNRTPSTAIVFVTLTATGRWK